jgi:Ig-like domain CHU_C associated
MCVGCGAPSANADVSLTPAYAQGRVTGLPGYISSLTYWPNGMVNQIGHGNGIPDTQAADASSMARPESITFGTPGNELEEYTRCTAPSIQAQPVSTPATITSPQTAQLTVSTAGSPPLNYQWYEFDVNTQIVAPISGGTSSSTTIAPTATKEYFVYVSNDCNHVNSNSVTVTVNGGCGGAHITSVSGDSTVASGTAVPLTAAATGSGSLTYQWYRSATGGDVPVTNGASASVTVTVTQTSAFYVKVSSTCGGSTTSDTSHDVVVTVRLPAPAGLTATLTGPTVITVSWQPVAGAGSYTLERRSNGASFQFLASIASGTQYSDAGRTLNTTYQYRAFAGSGLNASPYSGADLATTIPFTSITPGVIFRAADVNQLLDELNALRIAAGSAPVIWQQILPATLPVPAVGGLIYAGHIEALRREINTALQALGMPTPAYSDVPLSGVIRAIHLTELQQRAQ